MQCSLSKNNELKRFRTIILNLAWFCPIMLDLAEFRQKY
jgi:hypothetical protein